jgi:ATP phosphoribosyltransferase
MLLKSVENKPTELLIPEGSIEKALLKVLAVMDVPFEPRKDRCYAFALPTLEMMVTINRAKSIPVNLRKVDNTAVLGITGEDIVDEFNFTSRKPFDQFGSDSWKEVQLQTPPARLSAMKTPNAEERFGKLDRTLPETWQKWTTGVVFASYPQIAADYLFKRWNLSLPVYEDVTDILPSQLPDARIEKVSGKVEAQWWTTPTNSLVIDVIEGGDTMKANSLEEVGMIMREIAPILLIAFEKARDVDETRRDDLVELIWRGKEKIEKVEKDKE